MQPDQRERFDELIDQSELQLRAAFHELEQAVRLLEDTPILRASTVANIRSAEARIVCVVWSFLPLIQKEGLDAR